MIVSSQNILSIIPQRAPFVMIDELIACDETSSFTTLKIKPDNILVNNGELSEAGLLENIAQTAAAGAGYLSQKNNVPASVGYIGAIKNLEVFALPKIGDVITTGVVIEHHIFDATLISGIVKRGDALIAKCEMKIFIKK